MPSASTTVAVENGSGLTLDELDDLVQRAKQAGATGSEPVKALVRMNGRAKRLTVEVAPAHPGG